jgi:hypothetical protein
MPAFANCNRAMADPLRNASQNARWLTGHAGQIIQLSDKYGLIRFARSLQR